MRIACLGWGSLIWDPQALPIQRCWFNDGPFLPIEFARHSSGDRITLVIVPEVQCVRSLWALMSVPDLSTAQIKLAEREGIRTQDIPRDIGYWASAESYNGQLSDTIGRWASYVSLDAVVWTNLSPKFRREDRVPTVDEVISFLQTRPLETKRRAEEYIRKTPLQIDTEYRRRIELELGWTPINGR